MITGRALHSVANPEDVLNCFDTTAATTFGWLCRLVGSDGDLADELLADVYLSLRQAASDGTVAEVDDDWLISTAFHLADHHERTHGPIHDDLSVRDRALLDLSDSGQRGSQRHPAEIARIVGVSLEDASVALAAAERAVGTTTEPVADILRRSERWLDDSTRRRARSAIVRGERSRIASQPAGGPAPTSALAMISSSSVAPAGEPATAAPSGPGTHLGRPRKLMIGIAAGITVLLAIGFIWISPRDSTQSGDAVSTNSNASATSDDNTAATDATDATSPPSTTESEPTNSSESFSEPLLTLSPGFVLGEQVEGFEPVGVSEQLASDWGDQLDDSWREVWSEPGASRTIGRWFAIAISPFDSFPSVGPVGSERIAVAGHLGVFSPQRDGVSRIELTLGPGPSEGPTLEMIGYGLSLDELLLVAGSVAWSDTVSPTEPAAIEFRPSADVVLQRMTLVESMPTTCCGVSAYRVQDNRRAVSYRSGPPDQTARYLMVSTLDGWTNELVNRFLESSSPDPAAPTNPERTLHIGDRTVTVTGDVYSDGTTDYIYNSVRWFEGSKTIEIAGNVGLPTLVAAVSAARPAQTPEWRDLAAIAQRPESFSDEPIVPLLTLVNDVQLADGAAWSLAMSDDPAVIQVSYSNGQMYGSVVEQPFVEDPSRPVHELVTNNATVLVIALRDPGSGTSVRVTVAGREPAVVPLVPVGDTGLLAAIDAFRELPPYTVELVDGAGTTVRSLSS